MARGDLQRQRAGKGRPRYAIKSPKWKKQEGSRVVRFDKERTARGGLWHVPRGAIGHATAGVELMQSDGGCLYLTRTSRDGFVQGWRLLGASGKPLRVSPKHRPPR